jgi:hypothetical protein
MIASVKETASGSGSTATRSVEVRFQDKLRALAELASISGPRRPPTRARPSRRASGRPLTTRWVA